MTSQLSGKTNLQQQDTGQNQRQEFTSKRVEETNKSSSANQSGSPRNLEEGFYAINPVTGQKISSYPFISDEQLDKFIDKAWNGFLQMKQAPYQDRVAKIYKLADLVEKDVEKYAQLLTQQMGKPITQALQEVSLTTQHCRYYASHADEFLKEEPVEGSQGAKKTYVRLDPTGVIYQIVPFNYPIILTFLSAVPNLILGNSILHRNALTCPDVGLAMEKLFQEAGFNNGEFVNVFTSHEQVERVLADSRVSGVSFTGSTTAGAKIGEVAARNIKPHVLELGGSDPVLILDDADIDTAVEVSVSSRLMNGGQMCIAGKRFIVHDKLYDDFVQKLAESLKKYKVGDPTKQDTQMGPLAKQQLLDTIEDQVKRSVSEGGKVVYGGKRCEFESQELSNGLFYSPTIVECQEGNTLLKEETFGPVFAVIKSKNDEESLRLANDSKYGLSSVVITKDLDRAAKLARFIESGMVFVNSPSIPNSALPFGGVKSSGLGRENGIEGMKSFANIKSVWIQ